MEFMVPVLFIVVLFLAVRARAWQRRHTYVEEFWRSNGW
jgi:hypothetical protein